MNFAKWVFRIASIYGFVALLPHYFMESMIGRTQPPEITHPEFFYGFVGVGLACQMMFWVISRDPVKYRSFMLVSVFEKFSFVGPLVILALTRGLHPALYAPGLIDCLLGCLFVVAYLKTKPVPTPASEPTGHR